MASVKDITGRVFGRLTAVEFCGGRLIGGQKRSCWRCQCECGAKPVLMVGQLTSGKAKSCGCLRSDMARDLARAKRKAVAR